MNQDLAIFITPAALVLGCALIAAAILYVIDIRFLSSRTQAIAAFVYRITYHRRTGNCFGRQQRLVFQGPAGSDFSMRT